MQLECVFCLVPTGPNIRHSCWWDDSAGNNLKSGWKSKDLQLFRDKRLNIQFQAAPLLYFQDIASVGCCCEHQRCGPLVLKVSKASLPLFVWRSSIYQIMHPLLSVCTPYPLIFVTESGCEKFFMDMSRDYSVSYSCPISIGFPLFVAVESIYSCCGLGLQLQVNWGTIQGGPQLGPLELPPFRR